MGRGTDATTRVVVIVVRQFRKDLLARLIRLAVQERGERAALHVGRDRQADGKERIAQDPTPSVPRRTIAL